VSVFDVPWKFVAVAVMTIGTLPTVIWMGRFGFQLL
jgi:hypothetical protein